MTRCFGRIFRPVGGTRLVSRHGGRCLPQLFERFQLWNDEPQKFLLSPRGCSLPAVPLVALCHSKECLVSPKRVNPPSECVPMTVPVDAGIGCGRADDE